MFEIFYIYHKLQFEVRSFYMNRQRARITVRGMATAVALLLLSCLFSSCGGEAEAINPPISSHADDPHRSLTILTWEDYFSLDVIKEFEKEHGVTVKFEHFNNLDEMEALLLSRPSDFDLVLTSGIKVADLISLQLIQPLQRNLIPLFTNLDSRFLNLDDDRLNKYSVPYTWGPTLLAYRSDKIAEPEKSWKSLWDERYRGHVLMLEETFDSYGAALLASGHDLNSQNPEQLEAATNLLIDQADKLGARFVDINEVRDQLLSGECWISMTYSTDAAVLAEMDKNISYFIPKEGTALWLDSFVIPRESKHTETAHLFLDYFCRPEVAAANSGELWCASANRAAKPFLSKEILSDPTIYLSDEVLKRCQLETKSSPERQVIVNQGFKRIFDRVRSSN
jgi:spermidine/putrescine transport system substrate-binding protein